MDLGNMFREGGWMMYPTGLLGLAAVAFSVMHAVEHKSSSRIVGGALLIWTVGMGLLGTWLGHRQVDAAIASVAPEMRKLVMDQGYLESARPTQFAVMFLAVAIVPYLIGEIRTYASRPKA